MTVPTHPTSQRRLLSTPAARRNKTAMSRRGPQPSLARYERLAPAHRRHRKRPSKAPVVTASAENQPKPAADASLASRPLLKSP